MTRPTVIHDGFLVPNALGVSHPRMAEPDQIDFSTAANARWGVVDGCLVTVSGTTATTLGGIVIINGVMIEIPPSEVALGFAGAQDRFDLLVANSSGAFVKIPGVPAVDPVFPDIPQNATLLAAVFCPTSASNYADNVIDKRRFVSKSLLTKLAAGDVLIRNTNGAGDHYRVTGDGGMVWEEDAKLYRSGVKTITIEDHLQVIGNGTFGGNLLASNIAALGLVSGANLGQGASLPDPAGYALGSIWQSTTGRVYIKKSNGWQELATIESAIPVGTVITSIEPPSAMPAGWVAFTGQTITEQQHESLFGLVSLQPLIQGVAPNRSMKLPDARERVLRGAGPSSPVLTVKGFNQINLLPAQMPRHKHNARISQEGGGTPLKVTGRVGRAGEHRHVVQGGEHAHPVTDPGHAHSGGQWPAGAFMCLYWGGQNKVDALFNDRNHTYSVEAIDWTKPNTTGISIGSAGSGHAHGVSPEGDHDHPLVLDTIAAHGHLMIEDEMGSGAAIDITPAYISLHVYIRA